MKRTTLIAKILAMPAFFAICFIASIRVEKVPSIPSVVDHGSYPNEWFRKDAPPYDGKVIVNRAITVNEPFTIRTTAVKVRDSNGKQIAAKLTILPYDGNERSLGSTGPDGRVRIDLRNANGWIVASAAGYGLAFCRITQRWVDPPDDIFLTLPKECTIRGRVLDTQGKPISGAKVVVSSISAVVDAGAEIPSLKKWARQFRGHGDLPPADFRIIYKESGSEFARHKSPFDATTDTEGRYELSGLGEGHFISLGVSGAGFVNEEMLCFNQTGFKPATVRGAVMKNAMSFPSSLRKTQLCGPDPTVVMEPEMIIRGTVTDDMGGPRAATKVEFLGARLGELNLDPIGALTDKDGKYQIHGIRKLPGYVVSCVPDVNAGLLGCHASAPDFPGYKEIVIDLKCQKGIIVVGSVKEKSTGTPIEAEMSVGVLAHNPYYQKVPPFLGAASSVTFPTDERGRFRLVCIPGPVLLMASPKTLSREYRKLIPDQRFPEYFERMSSLLTFHDVEGRTSPVFGCWCKVINANEGDKEVTVDAELELAAKLHVAVVDRAGKPLTGLTFASGVKDAPYDFAHISASNELAVLDLDPGGRRFLAVIHSKKQLVGTTLISAEDKVPQVTLGVGGTLTGRVIDQANNPIKGLGVTLSFVQNQATEAYYALNRGSERSDVVTTDDKGRFRLEHLFPGQEFRIVLGRSKRIFSLKEEEGPKYVIPEHDGVLDVGDLRHAPPAPKLDE